MYSLAWFLVARTTDLSSAVRIALLSTPPSLLLVSSLLAPPAPRELYL